MTFFVLLVASLPVLCGSLDERATVGPRNYVFFGREHHRIADTSFLAHDQLAGAQLKYTWRELEPERDRYDLQSLREHLAFLQRHGKRLFVQLQDVSFSENVLVPSYLTTDVAFGGGAARKYEGDEASPPRFDGWVARRWDPAVRARFIKLIEVLGKELDGRIEGLVIPETAIGFQNRKLHPPGFTYEDYVEGIREITTAARRAFSRSCVILYGNFMPGEWLPGNDKGYLRAVYAHADSIGAGVGGPDLLPHRKGQQQHSYPLIARRRQGVVAGAAVQDGNLEDKNPVTGERVTVAELYRFARDHLRLDYIFWGTQEPYYSAEVLPYLRTLRPVTPQNPSPMVEETRAHERLVPKEVGGVRRSFPGPAGKSVELLVPNQAKGHDVIDIVVHFHGAAWLPQQAVTGLGDRTAAAVVNLGAGSGTYHQAFADPTAFDSLLAGVTREVSAAIGKAGRIGRLTLVGFSAGHGAVRAILREPRHFATIDGVLLLDGMHTSYVPEGTVIAAGGTLDTTNLVAFVDFARAAIRGEKRFVVTHSEIFPGTFASTTETANWLLRALGLRRTPVLRWGPRGMQQLSEVRAGRFELLGFAGNSGPDHIDHLHAMPELLARTLRR